MKESDEIFIAFSLLKKLLFYRFLNKTYRFLNGFGYAFIMWLICLTKNLKLKNYEKFT